MKLICETNKYTQCTLVLGNDVDMDVLADTKVFNVCLINPDSFNDLQPYVDFAIITNNNVVKLKEDIPYL